MNAPVEKIEVRDEGRLWEVHKLICDWVKVADQKAAAALAVQAALASLTFPSLMSSAAIVDRNWTILGLAAAAILFAVVSGCYAFRVLLPRLFVGAPTSNLFFAHIATRFPTAEAFLAASRDNLRDEALIFDDLVCQIWANSFVAYRKYVLMRKALLSFVLALILGLIAALANAFHLLT